VTRSKRGVTGIQIVIVDPVTGARSNGPYMPIAKPKRGRPRRLDHVNWTKRQTLERFHRYLANYDFRVMEAIIEAMNRLDCWYEAVKGLQTGRSPNIERGRHVLRFWNDFGLWSVGRGLRDHLSLMIDVFKHLMPPYDGPAVTLYRGEREARHLKGMYGISWTPSLAKAAAFAALHDSPENPGVILKIDAQPSMIVLAVREY
jgi:hypothetical protein